MERKIEELSYEGNKWIELNASQGIRICESYGAAHKELLSTYDLDQVFKAWKKDERTDKVTVTEIVNGLGCLFGNLMCIEFGLQWKTITDDFGTGLVLIHSKSSWETYPLDFVAKRVDPKNNDGSFFSAMRDLMHGKLYEGK
jgi:hypothetical protein